MMKDVFIDAIIGQGFHSMTDASNFMQQGLAEFTGNQWNESWNWKRNKLEQLDEIDLKRLYFRER